MGNPLPHRLPGKTVQVVGMYDAAADAVDLFYLQDNGSTWHSWFRHGLGWQGPEETSQPA